ncbi:hypothetical protein C8Q77DRAFT_17018 [Trametes polyzona]|nr:hypothetical protein C8Q77DRAFT_17018 [Trametes polyzona]
MARRSSGSLLLSVRLHTSFCLYFPRAFFPFPRSHRIHISCHLRLRPRTTFLLSSPQLRPRLSSPVSSGPGSPLLPHLSLPTSLRSRSNLPSSVRVLVLSPIQSSYYYAGAHRPCAPACIGLVSSSSCPIPIPIPVPGPASLSLAVHYSQYSSSLPFLSRRTCMPSSRCIHTLLLVPPAPTNALEPAPAKKENHASAFAPTPSPRPCFLRLSVSISVAVSFATLTVARVCLTRHRLRLEPCTASTRIRAMATSTPSRMSKSRAPGVRQARIVVARPGSNELARPGNQAASGESHDMTSSPGSSVQCGLANGCERPEARSTGWAMEETLLRKRMGRSSTSDRGISNIGMMMGCRPWF